MRWRCGQPGFFGGALALCCGLVLVIGAGLFLLRRTADHPEATVDPVASWATESRDYRLKLPEYKFIAGADESLLTPASEPDAESSGLTWWRSHGGNQNLRYSATALLSPENVDKLELAWIYHSGDGLANIQCNPVFADGKIFMPTAGNNVVALDPGTGREIWRYKPEGRPAHRGLTWLPRDGNHPARLLFSSGTYLYCLKADTGELYGRFGYGGWTEAVWSAVAPAVWEDLVIVAGFTSNVYAYHIETGKLVWQFNTIPGGEKGPPDENWGYQRLGANCWGGTALDASRGIFYISTGSPKPNFYGFNHTGKNLYANCIVALDAATGQKLWHFQEIRHDIWDLDIPAPPNLTSIQRNGRSVDVVTAVTKLGNTLLLDRVTGKPVFEFRLRRAPVSSLPGEKTWPYQPDPELPEPFSRMDFSADDVTDISPESRKAVLEMVRPGGRMDAVNAGWFEPFEEGVPTVFFGIHGGAEWTGACIDPETQRLYVTSNHIAWMPTVSFADNVIPEDRNGPNQPGREVYEQNCMTCHGPNRLGSGNAPPLVNITERMDREQLRLLLETGRNMMPSFRHLGPEKLTQVTWYLTGQRPQTSAADKPPAKDRPTTPAYKVDGHIKLTDHEGYPGTKPPWGSLNCINLNTGRLEWKVPLGEVPELTARGIPRTGTENFGGASVTAGGLVFASGTRDNRIWAFDKHSGEALWSADLPYTGSAPPTIFELRGEAYVVVPATGGGKLETPGGDALVAFKVSKYHPGSGK